MTSFSLLLFVTLATAVPAPTPEIPWDTPPGVQVCCDHRTRCEYTIFVPRSEAYWHLRNGDYLGYCPSYDCYGGRD